MLLFCTIIDFLPTTIISYCTLIRSSQNSTDSEVWKKAIVKTQSGTSWQELLLGINESERKVINKMCLSFWNITEIPFLGQIGQKNSSKDNLHKQLASQNKFRNKAKWLYWPPSIYNSLPIFLTQSIWKLACFKTDKIDLLYFWSYTTFINFQ